MNMKSLINNSIVCSYKEKRVKIVILNEELA